MSMLSVDYRQMQQRLQKLEGEHRQESEKVYLSYIQLPRLCTIYTLKINTPKQDI